MNAMNKDEEIKKFIYCNKIHAYLSLLQINIIYKLEIKVFFK